MVRSLFELDVRNRLNRIKGKFIEHLELFPLQAAMDDWDPFADPADAPPAPPAAPAPTAAPGKSATFPRVWEPSLEEVKPAREDHPNIPSLAELDQMLEKGEVCPELVQAAFEGDEKRVEDGQCWIIFR